jgi:hypothetical protein
MSARPLGAKFCRCDTACCLKLLAFERFRARRRESQKSCTTLYGTNDCFGQLGRLWADDEPLGNNVKNVGTCTVLEEFEIDQSSNSFLN